MEKRTNHKINPTEPETKASYGKPKTRFSYILSHLNKKTDRDSSYKFSANNFKKPKLRIRLYCAPQVLPLYTVDKQYV